MVLEKPMDWIERTVEFRYPADFKDRYRNGDLFRRWHERYGAGHLLFDEKMFKSRQIPHSGPVKNAIGFYELFVGIKYLDAGYDALWYYRDRAREKAIELLGGDAAAKEIITKYECKPQPPDLLVYCPKTKRFRFVECKGKNERLTKAQDETFPRVENYLTENKPPCGVALADPQRGDLFPRLRSDQWIHIVRVVPDKTKK